MGETVDPNLNEVMTKLGVESTVLEEFRDKPIANLTYGDLERIIKFVFQNNPVRWYDGKNFWKTSAFSLFNKYPAFDVTTEINDGSKYYLFPRLCEGSDPKVYLLKTADGADVLKCIQYANENCITDQVNVTIEGITCQFTEPGDKFSNLKTFLEKASKGVSTVEPPPHVKQNMSRGGSKFKKRTKARRTAHARNHSNNKVQRRHLERMDRPVAN